MSSGPVPKTGGPGPGVGGRLPPLVLPRAGDGVRVAWRASQRGAPVVVFLADLESGRGYVRKLQDREAELRVWSGRPMVVLPVGAGGGEGAPGSLGDGVELLADPDGEAHRRCEVGKGEAALFIADRWGQVYLAERAPSESDLPDVGEIEEWMRYLSTQCPECGVPDEPGRGEWEVK